MDIGMAEAVTFAGVVGGLVGGGIAAYKLTVTAVGGWKGKGNGNLPVVDTRPPVHTRCSAHSGLEANIGEVMRSTERIEKRVDEIWDHLDRKGGGG